MGRTVRKVVELGHKKLAKPVLFRMHPDTAHHRMVATSRMVSHLKPILSIARAGIAHDESTVLSQELFGLTFGNPIGISAGLDKNADMPHIAKAIGCGFMTCGSMTIAPREGNERPWFYRLPKSKSLVVHVGMANEGMEAIRPRLQRRPGDVPMVVSVAVVGRDVSFTEQMIIDDAVQGIEFVVQHDMADIIEINISCPNVHGDQLFAQPAVLDRLLTAVDTLDITLPVFIKMPNTTDWVAFQALLDVILKHRVDAVVIANLIKDRGSAVLLDHLPDSVRGGISGEPVKARALELIRQTYRYCGDKIAIVGVGGTFNAEDAYEKICAGASLVGLITGLIYEGPQLIGDINHGLVKLLVRDGYTNVSEAIGSRAR